MEHHSRRVMTFLLTDIVGSTRLWQEDEGRMRLAVREHDRLLAEAIHGHGGHIVKHTGDGVFAVFAEAHQAALAAIRFQTALEEAQWPTATPVRVRAGIHYGAAELRDGDYYGPEVNRCARIQDLAHGGQTLLSSDTAELVRAVLPEGAGLRDLGRHHLRDLDRAERVFQLDPPGLAREFPALRSRGGEAHNLPLALTSFVGREDEVARLTDIVAQSRLATLVGCGGCGKTRLAIEVAARVLGCFADGVWFVDLSAATEGSLVAQTVAATLRLREGGAVAIVQAVRDHLAGTETLLVLDNCEQVIGPSSELVQVLLAGCPNVTVLATSREVLGLPGEAVFRVDPLASPAGDRHPSAREVAECDAVRLFLARAREGLDPGDTDLLTIGRICEALDGIPLAIELAAARTRVLTVSQIAQRLDDRFRLLASTGRGMADRQRTLRATVDWSYELLGEEERLGFDVASVFPATFGLEAAEAILGPTLGEAPDALDLLTALADKSMLLVEHQGDEARYRMLETLRGYGRERLVARGIGACVQDLHLAYVARFVEGCCQGTEGACGGARAAALERELANLRAALEWAHETRQTATALRLSGLLWPFWQMRGYLTEGRGWLARALDMPGADGQPDVRAGALRGAAALAFGQGDYDDASRLWHEHIVLCERLGDRAGMAASIGNLGNHAFMRAEYDSAVAHYEEGLSIMRGLGDRRGEATYLSNIGQVQGARGDHDGARRLYEESLSVAREIGFTRAIPHVLCQLGSVLVMLGEQEEAAERFTKALDFARREGDRRVQGLVLNNFATLRTDQGDLAAAVALAEESLAVRTELGDRRGVAACLNTLADIHADRGDSDRAREMLRESLAISLELGVRARALDTLADLAALEGDTTRLERAATLYGAALAGAEPLGHDLLASAVERMEGHLTHARSALGEEAVEHALAAGASMDLAEAVALALRDES